MRILVAQGEMLVGLMVEKVLKEAGHAPLGPVSTAADALALAGRTWPELAVVDADLPGGPQAGLEVAHALLVDHGVSSIVAAADPAALRTVRHLLMGVMAKPFTATTLLGAVDVCRALLDDARPIPPIPARFELLGGAGRPAGTA